MLVYCPPVSVSDVASVLPGVLVSVSVRLGLPDGSSADVQTRVSDFDDVDGVRTLVVARPDLDGLAEPGTFPHEFRSAHLCWSTPTGQLQVRVSIAPGRRAYGPVWILTPIGEPTFEQRRQYFRVPLTLPATIAPATPRPGAPETGDRSGSSAAGRATLVEISEGGAQLTTSAALPAIGTTVTLAFTLDDTPVTLDAEVLRHVTLETGRRSAAVRFLDPTAHGDRIRRYAFAVQRSRARTPR